MSNSTQIGHFGDVPQVNLLAWYEKLNATQQKHTFTNQKRCNRTQKLKPGLVTSYDGHGLCLFLFWSFVNWSLTYLHRHLPTYLQPRDPHAANQQCQSTNNNEGKSSICPPLFWTEQLTLDGGNTAPLRQLPHLRLLLTTGCDWSTAQKTQRHTTVRVPVGVCFLRPTRRSSTSATLQLGRHCLHTCASSSAFGSVDCPNSAHSQPIMYTTSSCYLSHWHRRARIKTIHEEPGCEWMKHEVRLGLVLCISFSALNFNTDGWVTDGWVTRRTSDL